VQYQHQGRRLIEALIGLQIQERPPRAVFPLPRQQRTDPICTMICDPGEKVGEQTSGSKRFIFAGGSDGSTTGPDFLVSLRPGAKLVFQHHNGPAPFALSSKQRPVPLPFETLASSPSLRRDADKVVAAERAYHCNFVGVLEEQQGISSVDACSTVLRWQQPKGSSHKTPRPRKPCLVN
jgi:hypothetical protein